MRNHILISMTLLFLTVTGCPPPVCSPLETRCMGNVAEICSTDGYWVTIQDCGQVEGVDPAWVCCPYLMTDTDPPEVFFTCAPPEECMIP